MKNNNKRRKVEGNLSQYSLKKLSFLFFFCKHENRKEGKKLVLFPPL